MEQIVFKTDLSCKHCVMKVEPVLKKIKGIVGFTIDLNHPDKLVTIKSENTNIELIINEFKKAGYSTEKVAATFLS